MKTFLEWMNENYEDEDEGYSPPLITPEIKEWLGNSVMQQPLYHGTDKKFDSFQFQSSQRFVLFSAFDVKAHGFFFSEDYEIAKKFGRNIVTVYLKMMNPMLDPRRDKRLCYQSLNNVRKESKIAFVLRHMIKRHPENGGQYGEIGVTTFPVPSRSKKTEKFGFPVPQYDWIYHLIGSGGLAWDALDNPQVSASMKRMGFDGTFVSESEEHGGRSVFVPDSSQIKIVEWTR